MLLKDVRAGKKLEQHQRSDLASMDLPCTVRAIEIGQLMSSLITARRLILHFV